MAKPKSISVFPTARQLVRLHSLTKPNPINGCNEWIGSKDKDGYGRVSVNYQSFRANRLFYFLHYGVDPEELCVLHTCDNPKCVTKEHLFLGDVADNNADCKAKGRTAKGERNGKHTKPECSPRGDDHWAKRQPEKYRRGTNHHNTLHPEHMPRGEQNKKAKLTQNQVIAIRAKYAEGNTSSLKLAKEFGVQKANILRIVRREIWKHI